MKPAGKITTAIVTASITVLALFFFTSIFDNHIGLIACVVLPAAIVMTLMIVLYFCVAAIAISWNIENYFVNRARNKKK